RNPASIAASQDFFKSLCKNLEIPENISWHVEIAIEESLTHLFEYEMDKDSPDLLHMVFDFAEDEIKIVFDAPGRPFDFDRISTFDRDQLSSYSNVEGLGLFLLKHIMDIVQWKYLEKKGQQLVIIKKLPSSVGKEIKKANYVLSIRKTADSDQYFSDQIEYRLVRDYDDAFALTSCAYDLYHYEYKDVIYYPNELLSRNQNGLMRSWVAVAKNGTVYGHYALIKNHLSDTFAETGAAFVRPELRKAGVFKELAVRLHDDAVGLGLRGLFSLSVTNHIATQKISENYGRYTVGIRVASSPAVFVEGAKPGDRTTTTLNYHQIVERPVRDLFLPPCYREIITSTYNRLKIDINEKKDGRVRSKGDSSGRSFFDTYKDMAWHRALISARGDELICQKLQAFTDVLLETGIVCITLSIDLEDPSACALAETARKIGYFYSGIFPESFPGGHDALQMQLLNNVKVDPGTILIYQDSGKEIYQFIQNEAKQIFSPSAEANGAMS
ncbi:ATP-binding protein, partial [candidate division KSB1 bacterium]|nr:ATP-binding protein [candidate division KSB1 bacterium]